MLTQIYEISSADEARAVSAIGVDHVVPLHRDYDSLAVSG